MTHVVKMNRAASCSVLEQCRIDFGPVGAILGLQFPITTPAILRDRPPRCVSTLRHGQDLSKKAKPSMSRRRSRRITQMNSNIFHLPRMLQHSEPGHFPEKPFSSRQALDNSSKGHRRASPQSPKHFRAVQ